MSRYASKKELVERIKSTVASDYNKLGLPKGIENYNVAGLIRDCKIIGDRRYGYTTSIENDDFIEAIKKNLRVRT